MSKTGQKFVFIAIVLIVFQIFTVITFAQVMFEATVRLKDGQIPKIWVNGGFSDTSSIMAITFDRSSGGVVPDGNAVTELRLFDAANMPIKFKMIQPQVFLAERPIKSWAYSLDLRTASDSRSAAHLSWVADDRGVLMLRDILPARLGNDQTAPADIRFELPPNWIVAGGNTENSVQTKNVQTAVVVIGKTIRTAAASVEDAKLSVIVTGSRHYTESEASVMAVEIVDEYRKIFGRVPFRSAQISLVEHAKKVPPGFWTAETRGTNVTIISADMDFRQRSLQRLHEQLRHELFHLWMPNAVNFSGHYDWFYEGFAMYESLKIGVGLNRLAFADMLDTLSRAYAVDRLQKRPMPMAEASAGRFFGGESQVYARGMLLAFMTDIEMLSRSRGKRSVETLVRNVFDAGSNPSKKADGNAAVTAEMLKYEELAAIVNKYVKGGSPLEIAKEIEAAGLEFLPGDNGGRFSVIAKPNSGQRRLLDKLGYNSWRKLTLRK